MGSYSPRPVPPADLTVPAVGLFFLCSQAQGTEKSAGPSPSRALDARRMSRRGSPGDVLCPRPQTPASPGDPTLERGSGQASSGRSLTHGQLGWGSDSGRGHPHREEERGGRGGRRGGRRGGGRGGREGPGDCWAGGVVGRGIARAFLLSPPPSSPAGSTLLAPFSTLDPPKFFWYEIGPSLLSTSQLAVPGKCEVSKRKRPRFTRRS